MSGIDKLAAIRQHIETLPSVLEAVAVRSATELTSLAQASYDARQSVYGDAWPPGIDLHETGKLRSSAIQYKPAHTKIRVSLADVRWAKFKIKHGILPRGGAPLPASFDAAIGRVVEDECREHMAKAGVT